MNRIMRLLADADWLGRLPELSGLSGVPSVTLYRYVAQGKVGRFAHAVALSRTTGIPIEQFFESQQPKPTGGAER